MEACGSAGEQRVTEHFPVRAFEKVDVVLQAAVGGVRLLQPLLHVLQLALEATLHLKRRTTTHENHRLHVRCKKHTTGITTHLLLAPLQLTLLRLGSAQLALQVRGFRLRRSLFGQNPVHAAVHLREGNPVTLYPVETLVNSSLLLISLVERCQRVG